MGLRSRFQSWLEEVLPYADRATAKRAQAKYERQLAKSNDVQAEATSAILEARRERRAHLRGSYQRADERLARRR
jgi:stalled ribosome alternative rescue factor ArfA